LPWSTWPTMTTLKFSRSAGTFLTESLKNRCPFCPPSEMRRAKG
jgi:hypothetical protein